MNLPCCAVRDLLPLYAEELVSPESALLIREHLDGCADCRARLEEVRQPPVPVPEAAAPMKELKKELGRRRLRAAAVAALTVFLALFALFAPTEKLLPYDPSLLQVEGLVPRDGPSREDAAAPKGWTPKDPDKALVIRRLGRVAWASTERYYDEDTGELTVYLQYYRILPGTISGSGPLAMTFFEDGTGEDVLFPAPDRVIYGFGSRQVLLWGEPMNGGVEILPRLALAYYGLLAAGSAAVLWLAWLVFRRRPCAGVLRRLALAPTAYLAAQLAVKGTETATMFLPQDLAAILLEALAFYVWAILLRRAALQRRADREG